VIGPGIIVPIVAVLIVVPAGFVLFKRYMRGMQIDRDTEPSGARLTAAALHRLATPGLRVVYEVAPDALGGIDHVLLGPGGIFAISTSLAPMPEPPAERPSAAQMAKGAIARGGLDDVLRRCAMQSTAHVTIHWGRDDDGATVIEVAHGDLAVSGPRIEQWLAALPGDRLTPAQVDLAWQTVVTGIGRPDPLSGTGRATPRG
jgi:hypothetical protein